MIVSLRRLLELWFVQLEAQFALTGITADDSKFNHVISAIDSDILNCVCNIIFKPPDADKYSTLKNHLIELHSESEASKIRTLLQGLVLGDQRPSQLLARMKALAGDTVDEPLLKSLWLGRLPNYTQTILTALKEYLAGLASVADKINDLANHSNINCVTPQTSDNRVMNSRTLGTTNAQSSLRLTYALVATYYNMRQSLSKK
ncbi:uncharacterized protein TNCT_347091 [Trichonephila clavata]|uniref:DUF7041 domain-containing protein n=1 Tax=Trichonephila clavata TaxID=2740835 RepID=A0A8X6HMI2_TRICU|nr:uncharacterized protein TNCT_347091 [Trichonephila clavata]